MEGLFWHFYGDFPDMAIQLMKYANRIHNMNVKVGFEFVRFNDEEFWRLHATHGVNWSVVQQWVVAHIFGLAGTQPVCSEAEKQSALSEGRPAAGTPSASAGDFVALVNAYACLSLDFFSIWGSIGMPLSYLQ